MEPTPSTPTNSPVLHNKSSLVPLTILSLITLASILSSAYLYYQNTLLKSQLQNFQATPAPTPETPQETDPTADWKIYTNQKNKYSFKYPLEWKQEEQCSKLGYPSTDPCFYSENFTKVTKKVEPGDSGMDTITEYNTGTLLLVGKLNDVVYESKSFCAPGGPVSVSECKETILNSQRFATGELGNYPYPTNSIEAWLIQDGKAEISFNFSFSKDNKTKDMQTFNQILSTFRFSENGQITSKACQYNGKTYKNGDSVPADKCNSCSCNDGQIACTTMACE